jgi:hypothetical protein
LSAKRAVGAMALFISTFPYLAENQ